MNYREDSIEGRLLAGDPEAIGTVSRWVSTVLVDARFWNLRREWLDLHQDAMTGVLASLRSGRFDGKRDLRTYVMAVARFTLREAARRRRRRGGDPAPLPGELRAPGGAAGPPEAPILRSLALRRVLARLPGPCRELIQAYFFEQRDAREIAEALGIPIGTVKSRLFRCLECARNDLLKSGGARPRSRTEPEGTERQQSRAGGRPVESEPRP